MIEREAPKKLEIQSCLRYDGIMSVFRDERIWRIISTIWTIAFMIFLTANFFAMDKYDGLNAPLSAVYAGILTLYVTTKEFDRWYDFHDGRHPGEIFVIGWTILMFALSTIAFFSVKQYHIAPEVTANYILVLSIFALTQKSKQLHHRHRHKKGASETKANDASKDQTF